MGHEQPRRAKPWPASRGISQGVTGAEWVAARGGAGFLKSDATTSK